MKNLKQREENLAVVHEVEVDATLEPGQDKLIIFDSIERDLPYEFGECV